ncbi:MAG: aminotransferase class III-fold pyridoxal phosphate-dependent enzyme, partial [Acidobacteria bacterium]|nr:aminotransferase class III-fold pyridoxal phosphate-dependent enzyme [Acidobacteriota bacterium]
DQATRERAPELRDRVVRLAFERGVLVLGAGESSIRLSPPLMIDRDHADFAIDVLEESIQAVGQGASGETTAPAVASLTQEP